jgi:hypothetical protein
MQCRLCCAALNMQACQVITTVSKHHSIIRSFHCRCHTASPKIPLSIVERQCEIVMFRAYNISVRKKLTTAERYRIYRLYLYTITTLSYRAIPRYVAHSERETRIIGYTTGRPTAHSRYQCISNTKSNRCSQPHAIPRLYLFSLSPSVSVNPSIRV